MPERTQLSQEDEALRQVRLDRTVREGLRLIADTLTHDRPTGLMGATHRIHLARITAAAMHPNDETARTGYERQLLLRMPWTDGRQVTRGEYALWLHKTARSA